MPYFTHTEAGFNHRNEDAIAVQQHPRDSSALLCVLADGQGGQAGGEAASRTAVQKCLELAAGYPVKRLLDRSSWYEILGGADEAVSEHPDAGFTTLIGLCVAGSRVCGASCGDSAALLVGGDDYAVLTENQRKNPPIGSSAAFPAAFAADLDPGSKLLIMSDGVWRFVGDDAIAELGRAKRGQELVFALRRLQMEQNGGKLPDDFSMIVVQPGG